MKKKNVDDLGCVMNEGVEEGVKDGMENGVLGGYRLIDVKGKLFDGCYDDVD
ncbi:hypothetical protein [Staphylococcus epidermidis]|uniref:hypothetical protein n=1 Tax=Staphylococcus epidermidis TaxID=1282 RepID=UPI0037D9E96A